MDDQEVERLFQQGVAAIRAGDKAKARELLTQVVDARQMHEQAWLWLSAAVTEKEEQILCLENVLTINPENEIALKGMRKLGGNVPEPAPEPVASALVRDPEPPPPKPAEDEWRSRLKDSEFTSEATIVKQMHEGPKLGIMDLANAWVWATIFQIPGPYEEEVEYGPVSHILISVAAALLFELAGYGIYVGSIISNPKILDSFFKAYNAGLPASARINPQSLIPTGAVAAGMGTTLLILFAVLTVVTLILLLFQAFLYNRVAEGFGGKGNVLQTAQALGVSMVPSFLVMIPILVASVFLPGTAGLLSIVGYIYQFLQTSNAVNASHKIGLLASMGVVIIGAVILGVLACCLTFAVPMLIGGARR